tara:strand:- start:105 stop:365 length:261 start_codon:yes stop_codon:yes gene_type:complete
LGDRRSAVQICLNGSIANALLNGKREIGSLSNAFDLDDIVEFLKEVKTVCRSTNLRIGDAAFLWNGAIRNLLLVWQMKAVDPIVSP